MSHVFGLLLEYHHYHRDCVIRIYADDNLIDEICLQEDIKLKVRSSIVPSGRIEIGPMNHCPVSILPEKLFLFEIDDAFLNRRLRLEVENNNNNYTNGFMTEYSYIIIHWMFLIPKCLLNLSNWEKIECLHRGRWGKSHVFPSLPMRPNKDFNIMSTSNAWNEDAQILHHKRGGSFTMDFPLFIKHNVVHFVKPKPGHCRIDRTSATVLWFFQALNT